MIGETTNKRQILNYRIIKGTMSFHKEIDKSELDKMENTPAMPSRTPQDLEARAGTEPMTLLQSDLAREQERDRVGMARIVGRG